MSERMSEGDFNTAAKNILKVPCGYRERFVAEARRARRSEAELKEAIRVGAARAAVDPEIAARIFQMLARAAQV